ncbi:Ser-tRNA(Thr) hydrolase [Sulfodiicoccus acidiphilus]|uniref:Ser-tRNA(Thr) hydrolase n=1 Tax=Sulfodiicoccus acidiphilus TaxID=1670455 RepID=A0A348B0G1_9CREN|nr:threonyl-tRNA synthetase editing domain-containing protein [Sulfodiicoccus acidiphilus]BBD71663.1 Ser-tRNA(Thr) hydrolase [Sulfodiicoccus acidiphilus]GGT86766.1 Ser-tRNA(Thr) hydrolase [Sulfodiicoccus acidiphilus]
MRLLLIHADNFWFKVKERALREAEEEAMEEFSKRNVLVAFVSVEEGDDVETAKKAANDLTEVKKRVGASSIVIYPYAHLSSNLASPSNAIALLSSLHSFVRELGEEAERAPFGWYKEFYIHCLGHPLSELSRTVSNVEELRISKSLEICTKFDGVSMRFFRDAVVHYISQLAGARTVTDGEPASDSQAGVVMRPNSGKLLPCVNERIGVFVKVLKDVPLPENFEDDANRYVLKRKDANGVLVDVNRYIYYLLIEAVKRQEKGLAPMLPLWMAPIQIRLLPISSKFLDQAIEMGKSLSPFRVDVDDTEERLGSKIRRAGGEWIPFVAVIGEREALTGTLTVRIRESGEQLTLTPEELKAKVKDPLALRQPFPFLVSERS